MASFTTDVGVPISVMREFDEMRNIYTIFSNDIYKYFLSCLKGKETPVKKHQEIPNWDCCSLPSQPEFSQLLTFLS